jgi:hypothetical protein
MVSRRCALQWWGALIMALLPAARGSAQQQQKIGKIAAKYQERPHGQQRCEICLQFQPPVGCNVVAGSITPRGWRQFFAARENAH